MISVIVPFKEDRGWLNECIMSIRLQTYTDYELIMAQGPGSLPENFNIGLRRAKGEFIKMVQDDDWLPEDSLEILAESIGDSIWVVGNVMQECSTPYVWKPSRPFDLESQLEHYDIHMGSTLYRTGALRAIGGMDETLLTGEEYDMHLKLLQYGYRPARVERVVYHYRMWNGGKSVQFRRYKTEWRKNELKKIRARYLNEV